jgi:hypothetical protein
MAESASKADLALEQALRSKVEVIKAVSCLAVTLQIYNSIRFQSN